jgi:PKD repeat protein
MKARNIFYALVALLLLAASSCKKEDPAQVSTTGTPVFTFNANLNGSAVNLQGGVNNYYMYTSFTQDINNVYNFIGNLKPYSCSSCNNSLQIQINDFQASAVGAPATINTSLAPGYYAYQIPGGTTTQYSISFTSFSYNVPPQSWAWDFGDGTTSTVQSPTHIYTHPGNYTACLTTTFTNSTTGNICNPVYVGTPESGLTGTFTFTATTNNVYFTSSVNGGSGYVYLWDFGDGGTSSLPNPSHLYATAGVYLVSMKVTDANNHLVVFNRNIPTQTYTGSVAGSYFLGGPITNSTSLSNVIVNWTDASGLVYTSNNSSQPGTSYFKVLSVDPYNNNASGQTTKKIHAQLKCTLYNGSNTITLDNGDVVFAVAYH